MRTVHWVGVGILLFLLTALLTILLIVLSGGWGAIICTVPSLHFCAGSASQSYDANLYVATVIGIALSAIGTGALLGTIYYTAQATRAAMLAADAANLAIEHARVSSVRELRPYLAVDTIFNLHILGADAKADFWRIEVAWENVGATPARNVRALANSAVISGSLPADFNFPDHSGSTAAAPVGREKGFRARSPQIAAADVGRILRNEAALHIWSWVEYDGFEPGVRYRSEFHSVINFWGSEDPRDPTLASSYVLQERFNGIDEDCMRQPQTKGENHG